MTHVPTTWRKAVAIWPGGRRKLQPYPSHPRYSSSNRVTLFPELTHPNGGHAPHLFVPRQFMPPARHSLHLCRNDLESRSAS